MDARLKDSDSAALEGAESPSCHVQCSLSSSLSESFVRVHACHLSQRITSVTRHACRTVLLCQERVNEASVPVARNDCGFRVTRLGSNPSPSPTQCLKPAGPGCWPVVTRTQKPGPGLGTWILEGGGEGWWHPRCQRRQASASDIRRPCSDLAFMLVHDKSERRAYELWRGA